MDGRSSLLRAVAPGEALRNSEDKLPQQLRPGGPVDEEEQVLGCTVLRTEKTLPGACPSQRPGRSNVNGWVSRGKKFTVS